MALQAHVNNFSTSPGARRSASRVSGGRPYKVRAASPAAVATEGVLRWDVLLRTAVRTEACLTERLSATHREVVQGNAGARQEMCKAISAVTCLGAGLQRG